LNKQANRISINETL